MYENEKSARSDTDPVTHQVAVALSDTASD
jgi:hypothetical protein